MQLTKTTLILIAAIFITSCSKEEVAQQETTPTPFVLVSQIEEKHLNSWQLSGRIEPQNQAKLGFQVAGELIEKLVVPGEKVKQGQTLLKLNPQDLQLKSHIAQANLKATQSELKLAQTEARRATELVEKALLSQQDFDRIKNQVTTLEQKTQSLTSEVKLLKRQLSYTNLKAPAAGLVQQVLLDKGDLAQIGQPAVELIYLSGVDILVDIPESRIAKLPSTALAQIDNTPTKVTLRELTPKPQSSSRTWQAKYSLDIDASQVKFGTTARLAFASEELYKTVPLSAIFDWGDGQFVWQYKNNQVTRQAVEVIHLSSSLAYIKTHLPTGSKVIRAGVHLLKENQKVQERSL